MGKKHTCTVCVTFILLLPLPAYIENNIERRKRAKTKFEGDVFKLLSNSLYGVMQMNKRKQIDVKIACNGQKATYLVSKPHFKSATVISNDLLAVQMMKKSVVLDRPVYAGATILDISKR